MDLSKLSDADLAAIEANDLSRLSDEGLSYVEKHAAGQPDRPDTTSMAERFGTGFMDPVHGTTQLLTKALPDSLVTAGNALNNKVMPKSAALPEGGVDQQVRQREEDYKKSRGDEANKFDVWRAGGQAANPINWLMAPARAGSMLGSLLRGGTSGGLSAATMPVTEGKPEDYWSEKGKQVGIGSAFGAGLNPLIGALGRVVSPNASRNPDVQTLLQEGVTPTPGQTLGGLWNSAEQKATSIFGVGDAIRIGRNRAGSEFQNAAINRSQEPIGQRVKGTGQEAIAQAHDNVSAAYDAARTQLQGLNVDQQFQQDLGQLRQLTSNEPWAPAFNRIIRQNVTNRLSPAGGMTAETYHNTVKELGELAAQNGGSKLESQKQLGNAIQQLNAIMEQQARRSNPGAAQAFADADRAFANLATVEDASNRALNQQGEFSPAQYNRAIKQGDRSSRDNRTATGRMYNQDLGNAAQKVLGNTVPDSGTAGRVGLTALLAGGLSYAHPALLAASIPAMAMYTPPLQRAAATAIARRPQGAQQVAGALTRLAPRLSPAAGLIGLEATKD